MLREMRVWPHNSSTKSGRLAAIIGVLRLLAALVAQDDNQATPPIEIHETTNRRLTKGRLEWVPGSELTTGYCQLTTAQRGGPHARERRLPLTRGFSRRFAENPVVIPQEMAVDNPASARYV